MCYLAQNLIKIENCGAHSRSYTHGVESKFGGKQEQGVMQLLQKFESKTVYTQKRIKKTRYMTRFNTEQ